MNSLKRHFRSGFADPSLRRCCPRQVAILTVPRVSPYQVLHAQLKPLIMSWSGGVRRSTRLIAHWNRCQNEFQLGCNLAPAFRKKTFRKTSSACPLSGNPNVLFPGQHSCHFHQPESLSPLITRRCNHCVGVVMCLMRPAPLRSAMARPAVASNLISRLGLSTPSPNPFALTSTPCCCNIIPRSRIIETQPISAAAALTAAWNSASALERLTTACVVDVDFKRCFP